VRFKLTALFIPAILFSSLGAALTTPKQYAYQAEISEAKQALQRVELSVDVMLKVTRADMGDIAVFDAGGKSLPIWLRKVAITKTKQQFDLPIYLFNTYQQNRSKTLTIREQNLDQEQFSESTTTETVPIDEARQEYVIGLSEADADLELKSIELIWTHEPADQLLQLKIDAGNDLDSWRTLQNNKSLTNQNSGDAQWRTLSNIPKKEKYLRLTPINSIRSFNLTQAIGTYSEKEPERKVWYPLGGLQKSPGNPEFFKFDMPSPVLPLELKLIPGEQQSSVAGDLHASREGFEQKRLISSNIQQHNISGSEIEPSKAIKIPAQNYAHWWFKPNQEPVSTPRVEIAFAVYELLFLGNDNGPFTLAWGNHESNAPSNDLVSLLSPNQQQQPSAELVQLGIMQIAAGESRLSPQKKLPWLKWLLWLFLVVAVIITGNMAFSLYRDMNSN
jgi:hypothetical protein